MKLLKMLLPALLVAGMAQGVQAQSQSQLEKDLEDLRAWMRKRSTQADSVIQSEWPRVKQEYKELTYSLDGNTKKLKEESKAEYADLKQQYKAWEEENEAYEPAKLDGAELERWERATTGTTQIDKIKPANLRNAYAQLLDYTRQNRRTWTLKDWEYAEFVFGELNARKTDVLGYLSNGDRIKIAALQTEFVTLKKSREAKDAMESR